MIDWLWAGYIALAIFGLLIGFMALLIFSRLFSLVRYKKVLSFFTWLVCNTGIVIGPIKYLENVISKQVAFSQEPAVAAIAYANFRDFVILYLGGYGIGGLLVVAFLLRRMIVDQAFMDIFLPLRKEVSDQEVIALKLFLVPKEVSFFKKLFSRLTRRPLDDPDQRMTPDEAAIVMGVSRQAYDNYLAGGLMKLGLYLRQP